MQQTEACLEILTLPIRHKSISINSLPFSAGTCRRRSFSVSCGFLQGLAQSERVHRFSCTRGFGFSDCPGMTALDTALCRACKACLRLIGLLLTLFICGRSSIFALHLAVY